MSIVNCPNCGTKINPASLLGKGKRKTMTEAALLARKNNASKPRTKRKLIVKEGEKPNEC